MRTPIMTADIGKIRAEGEALYNLYNIFGRGRISEETFVALYLTGDLPEYIKRVLEERNGVPTKSV